MSYTLTKPYTEKQRLDFIVQSNLQGLRVEETATALYALEANEIIIDDIPQVDTEFEVKQAQEKQQRIAKLTMTPLDFINFLVSCGLTLEQINYYLETHLDVKMQLTYCSNVYCGVACALMPVTIGDITITEEMVVSAFIRKYEV